MRVSIRDCFGAAPAVVECTWGQFCHWMQAIPGSCERREKTDVPSLVLGNTHGGFLEEQIEALECVALDFDRVPMNAMGDFVRIAAGLGEHVLIHTTFNHAVDPGPDVGRFRVIAPLSEPVPHAYWTPVMAEAVAHFEGSAFTPDSACFNFARCWFVPAVNSNAPDWARNPWIWYK